MHWLWIALGGALGAISRYAISTKATTVFPTFPAGTLIVNIMGSLLFGFLFVVISESKHLHEPFRLAVLTGFLGALTTFSTFSFETVSLLKNGDITQGIMNIGANIAFCLVAVALGMHCGQWSVK